MNTSTPFSLRLVWAQGLFERGDYRAAAPVLADLVAEVEQTRDADREEGCADGAVLHATTDLRLLLGSRLLPLGAVRSGRGPAAPAPR
ncbi:MAG: hypothetical protein L0H96_15375 [Humibacillus sp.]|nr:hypothetical protein [Humibacillus sp.]MDN5778283.1 hypothetical protein [Humibacillus sp.]